MKAIKKLTTSLIFLSIAVPAYAAQQPDNSGLLTWLFLGFCGLIVVGQLVPALVMGFGMVKGVLSPADDHSADHKA